jgi:hypothetical protein
MLKIIIGVKFPPITTLHCHSDKEAVEVAFALKEGSTSKRNIGVVPYLCIPLGGGHP